MNRGRLGPKDLYGRQANNSADRLTTPLVREGGELVPSTWDEAMGRVVARSKELPAGPGGWGHNTAETQTVLWSRVLDRRRGPRPPALLVVDPRRTPVAAEADVHLAVRPGTNQALMNALLRGMIGRPGAGVLQMNGRPTAQNTRETGANGDLPGMRDWDNPEHVGQLAELWNVDEATIPHWAPPTHAMQVFRYAEQGSVELLWISATNPAVSLPEPARIRRVPARPELFVVVQDLFLTETALLADLDIFLDYARRMDFRDRDGGPLIRRHDAESAYRAWQECSRGRPCDYTGITYDLLRGGSGVQWGGERLYADGGFNTDPDHCETYGHDLATGAEFTEEEYRAKEPGGRAFLHAAPYQPSPEVPDDDYPLLLTTGRTVHHFHTRTKTARAPELEAAAPLPWVEMHPDDAAGLGLADGDVARVTSPRGEVRVPVRVGGPRRGVVFMPFHHGYWDLGSAGPAPEGRAANELTATGWDPVSKQPLHKVTAVAVAKWG